MIKQYTLPVDQYSEQTFDNFVLGRNGELMKQLRNSVDQFSGFWIYGGKSNGRSHLLRAKCLQDGREEDKKSHYVGCESLSASKSERYIPLKLALKYGETVAIDDIDLYLGEKEFELILFDIYQRLMEIRGTLLVSHKSSALVTEFVVPDLGSRLRALMTFQIKELTDGHKSTFLIERATSRGFHLSSSVINYWLSHGPRDMDALIRDFERLADVMLVKKQLLTIPLFKEVLGY